MKIFFSSLLLFSFLAFFMPACTPAKKLNQPVAPPISSVVETKPGWQVEWDKTIIEAKREGKITIYGANSLAKARDAFISSLRSRFGLEMDATVARGPEIVAKLIAERRAGLYLPDVILAGDTTLTAIMYPESMLDPIEPRIVLPEIKDPALWLGSKLPIWDKDRRAFSSLAQIGTLTAINTSFVKLEEISSFQDILNPKWKGKIIMSDPTTSGGGSSWASQSSYLMGTNYLKEVAKQEPFFTRDTRQLIDWLARGKYAIGLGIDTGTTRNFIRDGAPLSLIPSFKEGIEMTGAAGHLGVINRPPHPYAARTFINWFLSREGQEVFSKAVSVASRRIDVPTDHLEPWQIPNLKIKYVSRESEDAVLNISRELEVFKEIFGPLLKP